MLKSAIAIAFLLSAGAAAQQIGFDFDPAKTRINWSLSGNVHTTHGIFKLKQGQIAFDRASGLLTGNLIVDAASGDSGNATRDKRMNSDILESDKFPEFRFTPAKGRRRRQRCGRVEYSRQRHFSDSWSKP